MSKEEYIATLEEHIETADIYIEGLQAKFFRYQKDRDALKYWEAYKEGMKRAVYLAKRNLED